jgi:hypothetical protein
LRAFVGIGPLWRERMGVIADLFDGFDDARRVDLVAAPIDRKAALGEIEPCVDHARQPGEPALDLADASSTGDAFHGQRHV